MTEHTDARLAVLIEWFRDWILDHPEAPDLDVSTADEMVPDGFDEWEDLMPHERDQVLIEAEDQARDMARMSVPWRP